MLPYISDESETDDADWFAAMRFGWTQLGPDTFTRTPKAFQNGADNLANTGELPAPVLINRSFHNEGDKP